MGETQQHRFRFSSNARKLLRCSFCHGTLADTPGGAACQACSSQFALKPGGALDLRLPRPRKVSFEFEIGSGLDLDGVDLLPLKERPGSPLMKSLAEVPWHLSRELLSHLPAAAAPGATALDLGCGTGLHRTVCEKLGFDWVGLDYGEDAAPILGDAHSLPFADQSFDFILSLAVLEHLQYPFVAMSEAWRVLKPGASFIGTVAFLEPFHGDSFYHHTHLGTLNSLRSAGFEVLHVAPSTTWTVLQAQADMALFPRMPAWLRSTLIAPVQVAHRLWWSAGALAGKANDPAKRVRQTSGMFAFVARKP